VRGWLAPLLGAGLVLQLEGRVTDVFSMGIDFDINYDSRAPATVKSADYLPGTFLKVGFG
jgi:hypothetical protein